MGKLTEDKQSFDYDISWDIFEGCDFPDFSWEQDAVIEEDNECEEDIDTSLASHCVSGYDSQSSLRHVHCPRCGRKLGVDPVSIQFDCCEE